MSNLFGTSEPVVEKKKAVRKGPIMDRIEQHFRDNRYNSFTTVELYDLFEQDRPETIRNAIRKLLKDRIVKATGEKRDKKHACGAKLINDSDTICLTLTIGK